MNTILFLTYGDLNFKNSRCRIHKEACSLNFFDKAIVETEKISNDIALREACKNNDFSSVFRKKRGGGAGTRFRTHTPSFPGRISKVCLCTLKLAQIRILQKSGAAPERGSGRTPQVSQGGCKSFKHHHEQPLVEPHVSHFKQVPFRTRVKLPHSEHESPS